MINGDTEDCTVRQIRAGQFFICLTNKPTCHDYFKVGEDKFCQNPVVKKISKQKSEKNTKDKS